MIFPAGPLKTRRYNESRILLFSMMNTLVHATMCRHKQHQVLIASQFIITVNLSKKGQLYDDVQ
jgi:hypothetical protein